MSILLFIMLDVVMLNVVLVNVMAPIELLGPPSSYITFVVFVWKLWPDFIKLFWGVMNLVSFTPFLLHSLRLCKDYNRIKMFVRVKRIIVLRQIVNYDAKSIKTSVISWPRESYRRGRFSTNELLVLTSSDQLLFTLKNILFLFYKTSYLN